jgi:protein phosphatase 1B
VFDGHAGKAAAIYCRQHLTEHVCKHMAGVKLNGPHAEKAVSKALTAAFFELDAALSLQGHACGGTTCTSVFLTPTTHFFTNLGDSRTVLNRAGKMLFHTRDHKPYAQNERARIKNAGGFVLNGRVDGGLAVSRAFGDFMYKVRQCQRAGAPPPPLSLREA